MQDQPAQAALASNLLDPHYVKILCGTLEELPRAFAKLVQSGAATAQPALDRCSRDSNLRRRIRQWEIAPAHGPTPSPEDSRLPLQNRSRPTAPN